MSINEQDILNQKARNDYWRPSPSADSILRLEMLQNGGKLKQTPVYEYENKGVKRVDMGLFIHVTKE